VFNDYIPNKKKLSESMISNVDTGKIYEEAKTGSISVSKSKLSEIESGITQEVSLVVDQIPRFVTCTSHDVSNGNMKEYSWDTEKIFVHECLQDDLLMLQNVFEGKIISPLVYPLVFEHKSPQKEVSVRSLQFYKEVQNDASLYTSLSAHEKSYFLIGLRDLFIAACRDILNQDEKEILRKMVDLVDPNDSSIIYKTINNLEVAPYPTASHKMVRFIDQEADGENPILEECFVRNELGFLIGFVDPRDLSFHNFENIVNLDSLFKVEEDFSISNFQKHEDNELYTFDLADKNSTLLSLDKCGLYTTPVNKLSRGGERFIFVSKLLGDYLSSALKKGIPDKDLINNRFRFVNYVFRYNKFKPSDRKFTSHYDTPYHDPARKHYSKYTLILYLTPGTAAPVLSIDNGKLNIDTIENNGLIKGVIFDQKYEHEGKSFVDTDKIFMRSELVYEYSQKELSFDPDISRKFNIACYMTKQSVFNPELEKYASECFNQVAQARLNLATAKFTEDILISKKYHGIPFVTNGYDYWFQKDISLKTAAVMTLLDYFGGKFKDYNCSEYNEPEELDFDSIEELKDIKDVKDIFKFLQDLNNPTSESINKKKGDFEDVLVESLEYTSESIMTNTPAFNKFFKTLDRSECSFCPIKHPTKSDIIEFLEEKDDELGGEIEELKEEWTIFIFNNEIRIETQKIQINEQTITFNENIPTVNFASCQYDMENFDSYNLDKIPTKEVYVSGFANIPPIPYVIHDEGYHLKIELFNNGFVRNEEFEFTRYDIPQ